MTRNMIQHLVVACAAFLLAAHAGAATEETLAVTNILRHAVACPPFKGDQAVASIYHAELVKMLQTAPGIEYLEGRHALMQRAPEFTYRVNGSVVTNEDGQLFVMVTLEDNARKEQIASSIAPASTDPLAIAAWKRTIQTDMTRRASKLPFECRIRRQQGQESVSLDRGLDAGLQPGMVLYVSMDEEPLLSPITGEIVGRDSPRAAGQIEIFRVMERSAYARPVGDTTLPRFSRLYARTF